MIAATATQHARHRLQQRAIPPFVLELLDEVGSTARCGGAECLFFDKAARRRLVQRLGGQRGLRVIEPWLNVYAVIGDNGRLVTGGHRTGRFRRP